ncbi:SDR family NAD(P)-dependent oxidoreductase [Streptomyces sp. NPDC000151]|uniref:SDR family NAD(P)-dependent oxidoreductase n=1 Tax=Streptomyces sp. NPDC000151 TaxID=3154244 RepID=UPI003319CEE5
MHSVAPLSAASVVVNDVDAEAAEAAVKQITEDGGRAVAEVVAVGTTQAADTLVNRAATEFGRLDIMVTNAGVLRDRVLWKMSDEDFDTVQQVQLRATFTCARAAAIRMREQGEGGRMIVAGSPAGQRGNFGQTNYAAAKAGIAAMVRTWAMELAKAGITANAVVPNAATEMTKTMPLFAPYIEEYGSHFVAHGHRPPHARSATLGRSPSGYQAPSSRQSQVSSPSMSGAGAGVGRTGMKPSSPSSATSPFGVSASAAPRHTCRLHAAQNGAPPWDTPRST